MSSRTSSTAGSRAFAALGLLAVLSVAGVARADETRDATSTKLNIAATVTSRCDVQTEEAARTAVRCAGVSEPRTRTGYEADAQSGEMRLVTTVEF